MEEEFNFVFEYNRDIEQRSVEKYAVDFINKYDYHEITIADLEKLESDFIKSEFFHLALSVKKALKGIKAIYYDKN